MITFKLNSLKWHKPLSCEEIQEKILSQLRAIKASNHGILPASFTLKGVYPKDDVFTALESCNFFEKDGPYISDYQITSYPASKRTIIQLNDYF